MSEDNNINKTDVYRFSATDDESKENLWEFKVTRSGLLLFLASAAVFILGCTFCLIAFTPIRTFIPGYPNAHSKREAIQNMIRVDSLENVISRWELYSENLKRVMTGEQEPVKIDTIIARSNKMSAKLADSLKKSDSLLRKIVSEEETFEIARQSKKNTIIEGMHFFVPLKGVISKNYDPFLHPYIDITAPGNQVVMAALDGTVIDDYWTDEYGYVIVLQHANDIVSIYKHNQKLLKKSGDRVSAGSGIGLISNTGSGNDHLHFGLWYKGESVDPAIYLNL